MRLKKMTAKIYFIFIIGVSLVFGFNDKPGEITEQLDNGCTITRQIANTTKISAVAWYKMPLPHLNCSGNGHTRLDVEGVIDDVRSISISYNGLIELYIEDLKKFTKLEKLDARTNSLQRIIPSENTVLETVTFVSLKHNKLTEIPNDALKSFPNLQILLLTSNQIAKLYPTDFRNNPNIQFLYLGNNPITVFSDDWMPSLNLTGLNLKSCNLKYVPIHLSKMPDLFYVDLSRNDITMIPQRAFGVKIIYLQLTTNKIKTIHPKAFKDCYSLKNLDLSENLIKTIAPGTFDDVKTEGLQIDLYENPLVCNCSMAWFKRWENSIEDLDPNIEILYKCEQPQKNHNKKSNQLTVDDFTCNAGDQLWIDCDQRPPFQSEPRPPAPPADALVCPPQCSCWDEEGFQYYPTSSADTVYRPKFHKVHYPRVQCVNTTWKTIPYQRMRADIRMIAMNYNNFKTVNLRDFQKFKNLKSLDLRRNGIEKLYTATNVVWSNVTFLRIDYNNLTSITKDHFRSFPALKSVFFVKNKIKKFPLDLFFHNKNLTRAYLGPNPVTYFDGRVLNGLTNLYAVGLRNLSITAVPTAISTMSGLRYIDLSDNLFEVIKNGSFSKNPALYRIALGHNLLTKVEVNAFNGAISLASLDLAENYLTTLPNNCFSNISKEVLSIDIFQNKFICDCKLKWLKTWQSVEEEWDSTNQVRFACDQPLNLHGKLSEDLLPEDFVCTSDPVNYDSSMVCPSNTGPITLSVVVTFLVTALIGFVMWKCTFKRRYGELLNYAKQSDNYDEMGEM